MKKVILAMMSIVLLGFGISVIAQTITTTRIIVKDKPVNLMREGEVYVVPSGTTVPYYYYSDATNTRYVCTAAEPAELVGVGPVMLDVRMGSQTQQIRCYPETNFVIQ